MNQQKIKSILFYIMISVVVITCCYLIHYVHSESLACMGSPLTYGISKLKAETICSCVVAGKGMLLFDSYNITYKPFGS